jgi:hypothetical protein
MEKEQNHVCPSCRSAAVNPGTEVTLRLNDCIIINPRTDTLSFTVSATPTGPALTVEFWRPAADSGLPLAPWLQQSAKTKIASIPLPPSYTQELIRALTQVLAHYHTEGVSHAE